MTCSYCATELPAGAMFCGECGRSVAATSTGKSVPAGSPSADTAVVTAVDLIEPVDPELEPEPEPQPEPEPEPEPDPELEPEPEVSQSVDSAELCVQCGAALAGTDIFCGECGFVRQVSTVQQRPRDTVALDPFPWGLPVAPVAAEAAPPPFDDDIDETRIVDRTSRGERFVLQFSTGESVSVSGTGLLGRNPVAEPGEYFDALVVITDPGKSVSKTHLEFGQDGGTFWVSDRYSGNGTIVRQPESQPKRCDAGKRYRVTRGTRVDIGEQFFIVS